MPIDNYFFSQYRKTLSEPTTTLLPFKNHSQFSSLVDILCRKNSHHVLITADFSANLNIYYLQSFLKYINQETIPLSLCHAETIYLDLNSLFTEKIYQECIVKDFPTIIEYLNTINNYFIFAIANFDFFSETNAFLKQEFKVLLSHPNSRFIIFKNNKKNNKPLEMDDQFDSLSLSQPAKEDVMAVIKLHSIELENYHQILIPDELLDYAFSLGKRYFCPNPIQQTLLLLDSVAARTTITKSQSSSGKPMLSIFTLLSVLSNWTGIPVRNLQLHNFKYSEFIHEMGQKIFSQDAALTLLAESLHESQTRLHHAHKPYCSLLLVGPEHSGKKATVIALTKFLFDQTELLYFALSITSRKKSILDLKVQSHVQKKCLPLKELLKQTPYAVLMMENIDFAPTVILDELQEILSSGYLYDEEGNRHDFHQMTIILSTNLESNELTDIAKSLNPSDETDDMNLFQLVMQEPKHDSFSILNYSPQELADKVTTIIERHLPPGFCQTVTVLPFFPLNRVDAEKIISRKLQKLSQWVKSQHGMELVFAPEVIHHLTNQVDNQSNFNFNIERSLKPFYVSVGEAIFTHENYNQSAPQSLFLQLNENGQIVTRGDKR